jgi:hypothetical protein
MSASRLLAVAALAFSLLAGAGCRKHKRKNDPKRPIREALLAELQPVALSNCDLKRYGSANDGGYLACANLLSGVQSAYSYGIEHEDDWGCQLSRELKVPMHQYDCFTQDRPTCDGGQFDFHSECIGPKSETIENRPYDSLTNQITKNGDKDKHLLIKMDVEGAEWDSIMATSDDVLANVDQFIFEFHGADEQKFVDEIKKLKKTFHLVWLHYNNYECSKKFKPLEGRVFEILFVNKKIGTVDPKGTPHAMGSAPDMPNNPNAKDCNGVAEKH